MDEKTQPQFERIIGLDAHPDSFTAAVVLGPTPLAAVVEKVFNKVPLDRLATWMEKQSTPRDLIVLEASGNSFYLARTLTASGRQVKVLESCHLGKLKEAHANNDKISAVRIAKAFLAGTAKEVWVPDEAGQERRDWHHRHRKAVKRSTQARNSLKSYLSDNGVRLPRGMVLTDSQTSEHIRWMRQWSEGQWVIIEDLLNEVRHADQQRRHWRSLITLAVLIDPLLLSIVRLCGVRDLIAYSLGAIIGDIHRFSSPKKLVKYVGLNPAFDDSGEGQWTGGIGGHGRKDLRWLLIEAAHSILRSSQTDLARWGKKLLARKGEINLVVAAVARKLTVAVWYLMMGRWTALEEVDRRLSVKIGKMISQVGAERLQTLNKDRKAFRHEIQERLKTGRTYVLKPDKKYTTHATAGAAVASTAVS